MRLVCCDVDGTLLTSDGKISSRTLTALTSLCAQGDVLALVSARNPGSLRRVAETYELRCLAAAFYGAVILDERGRILRRRSMDEESVRRVVSFIRERLPHVNCGVYGLDAWVVPEGMSDCFAGLPDRVADKVLCVCEESGAPILTKLLRQAFPELSVGIASPMLTEVMAPGVGKAHALLELCDLCGVPRSETAAFGDGPADVDMLRAAAYGFLMGNAHIPDIPGVARTEDNDSDGIPNALARISWLRG